MAPKSKPKVAPKPKAPAPKAKADSQKSKGKPKPVAKQQKNEKQKPAPKAKPKAKPKASKTKPTDTKLKTTPKASKSLPKKTAQKSAKKSEEKDSKKKTKKNQQRKLKILSQTLFEKPKRIVGIGQCLPNRKIDLTRYVKWPGYVNRTRKLKVLRKRFKVPPAINQFNYKTTPTLRREISKFLRRGKYAAETKLDRRIRLRKEANEKLKDPKTPPSVRNFSLKFGAQRVSRYVEQKRAKLVLIANDVEPIEVVMWLPTLCVKMNIPYVIISGKAWLGRFAKLKTASCACLVDIRPEDKGKFEKLLETVNIQFVERQEERRKRWGGNILPKKTALKLKASKLKK